MKNTMVHSISVDKTRQLAEKLILKIGPIYGKFNFICKIVYNKENLSNIVICYVILQHG